MSQSIKRIGHYAPVIWAKGGIASYIERLGNAQADSGLDVHYFTQQLVDGELPDQTTRVDDEAHLFRLAKDRGLDVLHLHKAVQHLPKDRVTTVRTMHGNQGSCPTGTRYLQRSEMPCNKEYSLTGCLANHVTERCGSLRPSKVKKHFKRIRNEQAQGEHIHTFTVSQFLRNWMLQSGYREEKLHVIHSPAPDAPLTPGPPPASGVPHFLFLGRLVPQKGPQWLIRSMLKMDMQVKLDIGGDGPLRGELEDFCNKHGLQHRVKFHGWLPQDRVKALIAYSRAVVVPSMWHEPAGLVTLEAAAAGRAVIASRVGGIPEYALDDYSLLVKPGDTMELAQAILRLAREYDRAVHMGECALRNARNRYAMSQFVDKQLALYQLAMTENEHQLVESEGIY